MDNGIVCKVWNIQGTTLKKSATSQLSDSISYILNEEKTDAKLAMQGCDISDPMGQLGRECQYVENDIKTVNGAYVGSRNLVSSDIKNAVSEMMEVKNFYDKLDGRAALHGIISLPVNESDESNASSLMQLCEKVMEEVFPNNQAIFGVHTNTDNLHIHFIINSVGLDGRKIHQNDKFIKQVLHPCINKYAKEYGFSQNEKWLNYESTQISSFAEIKIRLRKKIDFAIENSDSFDAFIETLKQDGISVNVGKYISLKEPEMDKAIRTHNLGYSYSKDAIIERIRTRREKFEDVTLNSYVINEKKEDVFIPTIMQLKKYKDMSSEQKEYVIHQLKLGNNPWREHQQLNWQLNNIANELNIQNRVVSYIDFYSKNGSLQGTLDGIVEAKKYIALEKKIIKQQKRKYKPIIDIYEEMKKIERKAYLYEHENIIEFRPQFEQYRELTRRLKKGYNKDIYEVASFLEECDERLLYAHAQLHELSLEYREIKQYAAQRGEILKPSGRLTETIGVFEDKQNVRNNIFEANIFYVTSEKSDIILRIVKSPKATESGKLLEEYEVVAMSKYGEILETVVGQSGSKDFINDLSSLEKRYHLNGCKRFGDIITAREFIDKKSQISDEKYFSKDNIPEPEITLSFTQAINHCNNASQKCYVVDKKMTNYYIASIRGPKEIKLVAYSKDNIIQETVNIPLISQKSNEGYLKIVEFQKKYGFSDYVQAFDNNQDVHKFIEQEEAKLKEPVYGGYRY